jgi:hypothetical protein
MARWIGSDYNEDYGIVLPGFDDPVKPRQMTDATINILLGYNPELVVYFDMLGENPVGSVDSGGNTSGDKTYIHPQSTPSSVWEVWHHMGKIPTIDMRDSSGRQILGFSREDVEGLHKTILTIGFSTSGKAICN